MYLICSTLNLANKKGTWGKSIMDVLILGVRLYFAPSIKKQKINPCMLDKKTNWSFC